MYLQCFLLSGTAKQHLYLECHAFLSEVLVKYLSLLVELNHLYEGWPEIDCNSNYNFQTYLFLIKYTFPELDDHETFKLRLNLIVLFIKVSIGLKP